MTSIGALLDDLATSYPDDAEDLKQASEVFQQQKLSSCERVAKLTDGQWQRLQLPIGIETLIREEVSARLIAAASSASAMSSRATQSQPPPSQAVEERESDNETAPLLSVDRGSRPEFSQRQVVEDHNAGLRRRHQGHSGGGSQQRGLVSHVDLTPPDNVEELWQQLLADTLSPDKRVALQETWDSMKDPHDKYMMFLEYSSYLRKPTMTPEEREERRKQLEPLMKEFGVTEDPEVENDSIAALLGCVLVLVVLFIAGVVYYSSSLEEPHHDVQSL